MRNNIVEIILAMSNRAEHNKNTPYLSPFVNRFCIDIFNVSGLLSYSMCSGIECSYCPLNHKTYSGKAYGK